MPDRSGNAAGQIFNCAVILIAFIAGTVVACSGVSDPQSDPISLPGISDCQLHVINTALRESVEDRR